MKIKCIVVDDEPLAIEILETYIEKVPYLDLVSVFSTALDALQYLKENPVDAMFLDIQMPDLTGIQLMKVLNNPPMVVFTTAFDNYAIKSYELEAVDYLLKPIEFDRFLKASEKIWKRMEHNNPSVAKGHGNDTDKEPFIFIRTEYRMQRIEKKDILYIEGMKNYLRVVTRTARYMTLQSFKNIQQLLPEPEFVRIHKSFIVAIDKIDNIERGRIKIGNQIIPVGDTYKKNLEAIIDGSIG